MIAVTMPIRVGRLLLLTFMLALCAPRLVAAAAVRDLDVTHNKETYLVTFDVLVAAEAASVREFVSDYTQWPRLSNKVREGQLLKTFPDGRQRVRLDFRSCVLIFCKTIRQIKDVTTRPNGDLVTVMVPERGDFKSGWERWQILVEQNQTRVLYDAVLVPSYRGLPLIGPWIVKSSLRRMLIDAAKKMEALATP
jgi:hypothetical protein